MKQYRIAAVLSLTLSLLVLTAAGPAAAQERPCAEDLAKYCGGVTPGGGRLVECYKAQKANMSRQCVVWAEFLLINANDLREACTKEIDSSCNREKGDPMEMLACLQSNYVSLAPKCSKKLAEFQQNFPKPVQ